MKKVFTIMMTLSRPSQARKALTRRRLKASRGGLPMWNISTRTAAFSKTIQIFNTINTAGLDLNGANSSSKCKFIVFCLKSILLGLKTPVFSLVCC